MNNIKYLRIYEGDQEDQFKGIEDSEITESIEEFEHYNSNRKITDLLKQIKNFSNLKEARFILYEGYKLAQIDLQGFKKLKNISIEILSESDNPIFQEQIIDESKFLIEFREYKDTELSIIIENGEFTLKPLLAALSKLIIKEINISAEKLKIEEKYDTSVKEISKSAVCSVMNMPNVKLDTIEISENCSYNFTSLQESEKTGYKYAVELLKDDPLF